MLSTENLGFDQARVSNTGPNSQNTQNNQKPNKKGYEIGVDYLTITALPGSGADVLTIIELIEGTFREKIEYSPTYAGWDGKPYMGSSSDSLMGTRIYTNPPSEEKPFGEMRIKIPGKPLSAASMHSVRDMCQVLQGMWSATCSRFDVAIDDYSKTLNLDEVKLAQELGNFAYVEKCGYHESGERGKRQKGRTITFGSRQSQAYLRVYDKSVESQGETDAMRYEVEFKDDKAQFLFEQWCDVDYSDTQASAKLIAGAALGAVRFCDRSSGDRNLDRLPNLPWYEKLLNSVVTGYRLRVKKKQAFLNDSFAWVERSVVPTLSMLRKYMGDDVFLQWVYDKTEEHLPFLSLIKREKIQQQQQLDREQQQQHDTLRKYIVIGKDGKWCVA